MNSGFRERLSKSAEDFVKGVQPALEKRLNVKIYPVENHNASELMRRLDWVGVDGFYYNDGRMHCLASRVQRSAHVFSDPVFSFRYALGVKGPAKWDWDREFSRLIQAARAPQEYPLFPRLHVESFSRSPGSGEIEWSFAAKTRDILSYFVSYYEDKDRVKFYEPKYHERRKVLEIPVAPFADEYEVIDIFP